MDPITLAAIMGGGGLLKGLLVDKPEADKQRQLASATQRYSPWTGLQAQAPKDPDVLGDVFQGAATGAALGQNMQAAKAAQGMKLGSTAASTAASMPSTVGQAAGIGMAQPTADFGSSNFAQLQPLSAYKPAAWSIYGGQ